MSDAALDIKALFCEAIEKPSADALREFLDSACAGDEELRAQLEELLKSHREGGKFLGGSNPVGPTQDQPSPTERPGAQIGPYKLLQQIGEGGMGVVFMAEQTTPVRRIVALKVIKPGMDSRQVIARFDAERQALAMMDHVNIARVLDAGTTADCGRPYFVMELVHGVPINKYCDDNQLTPRQRLELFVPVCQAIQHAHQKGIIHRDIKPSNVMITLYDGTPVPKVIDFGVAKATEQRLTERTLFTQYGTMVGTLEYMSPEQAEMSALGVDTRSDIYSLGVLLYELLTGSTPLSTKQIREAAYAEILRMIKEDEPPKPSLRLSDSGEALACISAQRHMEPAKLTKLVRGELDWIAMKCLEKDRNRRYATASALATDIERYLHDEPVDASPPSATYKLRKLARKNRGLFAGVTIVALSLIAATIFSSWQAIRATRAMAAAVAEKQRADQEAMTAKRITESFQEMLGLMDPDAASYSMMSLSAVRLQVLLGLVRADKIRGPEYTILQLIDDFAENVEGKLGDQPVAAAQLHATIGGAYAARGDRNKGRKHLERALELARSVYGEEHDKYADFLVMYARPDGSDPTQRAKREADLRRALAIYRARGVGGERVIRAIWVLLWNLGEQGHGGAPDKFNLIEPLIDEGLAEARKFPGVVFDKVPTLYNSLAGVRIRQAKYAEAEQIARQNLPRHLKLHPHSLMTGWGYHVLGEALRPQGKFAEALVAEKKALAMMRAALPHEHPSIAGTSKAVINTLVAADNAKALASVFPSLAELGELESIFRDVLKTTKPTTLRWDDPAFIAVQGLAQVAGCYRGLSRDWGAAGKKQEAEEAQHKATLLREDLRKLLAAKPDLRPAVETGNSSAKQPSSR